MKTLLFSFIVVLTMGVSASPQKSFEVPAAGEITAVSPLCPQGMMCITNGSIIDMVFRFSNGCSALKVLKFEANPEAKTVEVEAVESRDPLSMCTTAIVERAERVTVPSFYPPFVLSFKGTGVVFNVTEFF
ncbi:MAG: hypothetical protein K2Q26_05430 [Bdellovibrionales bacterium]|nr:hypothetical protein [Bdellovibrionales bacterium]